MAGKANEADKVEVAESKAPTKALTVLTLVDGEPQEIEVTWEVLPPAEVAYYYVSEKNPTGASFPGVPLADLLAEQVKTYPKWVQKSIAHSDMYSKDPPVEGKKNDKQSPTGDGGGN